MPMVFLIFIFILPLQEMQREHNNLSSQLQQGTKRLNQLEEERKCSEQSLKQSRNMVEDLKGMVCPEWVVGCINVHD